MHNFINCGYILLTCSINCSVSKLEEYCFTLADFRFFTQSVFNLKQDLIRSQALNPKQIIKSKFALFAIVSFHSQRFPLLQSELSPHFLGLYAEEAQTKAPTNANKSTISRKKLRQVEPTRILNHRTKMHNDVTTAKFVPCSYSHSPTPNCRRPIHERRRRNNHWSKVARNMNIVNYQELQEFAELVQYFLLSSSIVFLRWESLW